MGRTELPGASVPIMRHASAADGFGISEMLEVLGYPCSAEEASERVLAVREDPNQVLMVADLQGGVVGLVCCDVSYYLPLGAATCRITALAVATRMQRQGVGRLLLREAERLAREAGAARIELTSAQIRTEAHAFYRECGYREGALRFIKRLGDA